MKSLREIRKAKDMSLINIKRQLGINNLQLHNMESVEHTLW
jgi:hypothetical protein